MRGSVRRSAAFPRALGTRSSPQDDGARPADTGPSLSCRIKRWGVAAALILGGLLAGAGGAWAEEMQEVVVKPGDTLWSISQKYLKDPTHWNVIVRHNKLPTSDPTIALPGMTLRVPKEEIKEDLRAAEIIHMVKKVLFRLRDKAEWKPAAMNLQIFHGDGLRTMADSWARVRFFGGFLLSLEPNSMAVLKSPNAKQKEDHDIRLMRGGVHTTLARVVTPSARIVPKGTDAKYTARVMDDLSTRVQVYKGAADVQAVKDGLPIGKAIEVKAGFATEVPLDGAPAPPTKAPNVGELPPEMEIGLRESAVALRRPAAGEGADADIPESLLIDLKNLEVGVPVAAVHVQVSDGSGFDKILFEKTFESDETVSLREARLAKGRYYVRAAIIDLLGSRGRYSAPKEYLVGGKAAPAAPRFNPLFEIVRPAEETVKARSRAYRVMGRTERGLEIRVNGRKVPVDDEGNFSSELELQFGPNAIRVEVSDLRGNSKVLTRSIVLEKQ